MERRWYFSMLRISRSACWRWLPPTPASNGSSWMAARSIASTAPERRCWKRYRKTCARGVSGSALPTPEPRLAPFLERSGVQAVLGDGALCTTLKSAVDACASGGPRNIGNRKRTLAGTRTRGIPVRATRLTPHTGDPFVTLCAKEIHYRSVALLIIYMSRKQLYIRHSLSYPAPIGDAKPYCEKSFLLDEFLRFDTELVTGKRRDSKLELPLREDVTTRQAAV